MARSEENYAFDDEYSYDEEFDALSISVKQPEFGKYPGELASGKCLTVHLLKGDLVVFVDSNHSKYSREASTDEVQGKLHARSVAKHLGVSEGLIYIPGRLAQEYEDSDQPVHFRQRRNFFYLCGANFEDCALTYNIGIDTLTLYIPSSDAKEVVWLGPVPSIAECERKYDVDRVAYKRSLLPDLGNWYADAQSEKLYLLHKYDLPAAIASFASNPAVDSAHLIPAMDSARVIKSPYEIEQIRKANKITGAAHRAVLTQISKMKNERQIDAIFQAVCISKGAKNQAYGVIAGSGVNASTLHYAANEDPLKGRQLVVLDAGCEWNCYASDVTRTFPVSGTWTKEAKEIYDLVDTMQRSVLEQLKPGVLFRNMHILSVSIAVKGLMKLGILHNGTFEEVYPSIVAFYPHGLGHHLGLECHDVTDTQRLLSTLATHHDLHSRKNSLPATDAAPQIMKPGMVVTVEPGIYFSRYAIEKYWLTFERHRRYINTEVLERYYAVGGVRIEDDFLITEGGWENLTTAPKGEEALRIISGGGEKSVDEEEEDWF